MGNFGVLAADGPGPGVPFGVYGQCGRGSSSGPGAPGAGVYGASGDGYGVCGGSDNGIGVLGYGGQIGVMGATGDAIAVCGETGGSGIGIYGKDPFGSGYAGKFDGQVLVNGNLSVRNGGRISADNVDSGIKQFKIDHVLDPANKCLCHSSVESSDMKNIYDGVVVLNSAGEAVVELPDWFEALNQDFRYQLTPIGAPGPNLYIAQEILGNRFRIAGGSPRMKVSWQVTGVRHDPYADAHRVQVEEDKPEAERGYYLHPELYGQPRELSIEWARNPGLMRRRRDEERYEPHPALAQPGVAG